MLDGDEMREPLRFAEDDDSDDLGGFSRGKRSYEDEEDEENGGWAINEDHSDRLWDSAEDVDDDDDEETRTTDAEDVEDDDEEEDLFGGGAPRGRRGRPKGSTNANREKALSSGGGRESTSAFTGGSLFDDADDGATAPSAASPTASTSTRAAPPARKTAPAKSSVWREPSSPIKAPPKRSFVSSGGICRISSKIVFCTSGWWIRIEPPPSSTPLTTMS